jgi:hypothetical protein
VVVLDDVQVHQLEAGYRSVDSIYEKGKVSLTRLLDAKARDGT